MMVDVMPGCATTRFNATCAGVLLSCFATSRSAPRVPFAVGVSFGEGAPLRLLEATFPRHLFAFTVGIPVGRIKEVAALFEIAVEERKRALFVGVEAPLRSERHCPEAERAQRSPERSSVTYSCKLMASSFSTIRCTLARVGGEPAYQLPARHGCKRCKIGQPEFRHYGCRFSP